MSGVFNKVVASITLRAVFGRRRALLFAIPPLILIPAAGRLVGYLMPAVLNPGVRLAAGQRVVLRGTANRAAAHYQGEHHVI